MTIDESSFGFRVSDDEAYFKFGNLTFQYGWDYGYRYNPDDDFENNDPWGFWVTDGETVIFEVSDDECEQFDPNEPGDSLALGMGLFLKETLTIETHEVSG